jgi:hypothetical protein
MFLMGCTTGSKTNLHYHVNTTHHHHHHNQQADKQIERKVDNVAVFKCSNGYMVPEERKALEIYY